MVGADSVLGGSGPMVPEAFPIKKGYDSMERRNGVIKPKQKAGNAILGWVAPGTGLVDKQLSGNLSCLPRPWLPGQNGKAGSQAS